MRRIDFWILAFAFQGSALVLPAASVTATNGDVDVLVRDLAAVERVYYNRRTDDKPPFEQAAPRELIEKVVRQDLRKEAALKKVYGIEVTPAQIESELRRLTVSARAPDLLAELQSALDNDPARFARTIVRPIVVDRVLRDKFDHDEALHKAPRRDIERIREQLLQVRRSADTGIPQIRPGQPLRSNLPTNVIEQLVTILTSNRTGRVSEILLPLTPSAAGTNAPADAQDLSSRTDAVAPATSDGVPPPIQVILRFQLQEPGDISTIIETPEACRLYVAREIRGQQLRVATLAIPKRSYEEWLDAQDEKLP